MINIARVQGENVKAWSANKSLAVQSNFITVAAAAVARVRTTKLAEGRRTNHETGEACVRGGGSRQGEHVRGGGAVGVQ